MKQKKTLFMIMGLIWAWGFIAPSVVYAQKKEISQAKEWVKKRQNLDKAQQTLQNLLKDSANRTNEKIYLLLYDAVKAQYEQGNEKLYLKQQYDTAQLFRHTLAMFDILGQLDSVDRLPDRKGRVKLKYREQSASILKELRPNLYGGGIYFIKKQNYSQAYDFFDTYITTVDAPLFARTNLKKHDTLLATASYWAVYCGYKLKNPIKTLKHTYLALRDTAHYGLMLQYLAETYLLEQDTTRYLGVLAEGFDKYPEFPYFFPRLVKYYSSTGLWDKALALTDSALRVNCNNSVFLYARASVLVNTGRYNECLAVCDTLFSRKDTLPDVNLYAGLSWFNQAVELDKKADRTVKVRNKILTYYKRALPYLQRYRKQRPNERKEWALPLYTIYLNLNMGKEFDEIEQLLKR